MAENFPKCSRQKRFRYNTKRRFSYGLKQAGELAAAIVDILGLGGVVWHGIALMLSVLSGLG